MTKARAIDTTIGQIFALRKLAGTVSKFDVKLPRSRGSKYVPHEGAKQQLKAAKRAAKGG